MESDQESRRAELNMDRDTNPRLNRREVGQADADDGLGPKGKDAGRASLQSTRIHPRDTRRRVGSDVQRHTEVRNGVTPWRSPRKNTPGEEVSTGYATVGGWLKQPRPRGTPVEMRT